MGNIHSILNYVISNGADELHSVTCSIEELSKFSNAQESDIRDILYDMQLKGLIKDFKQFLSDQVSFAITTKGVLFAQGG